MSGHAPLRRWSRKGISFVLGLAAFLVWTDSVDILFLRTPGQGEEPVPVSTLNSGTADNEHTTATNSAASSQFVEAGDGVKLEVLDWGGDGRPVVVSVGPLWVPFRFFDNR